MMQNKLTVLPFNFENNINKKYHRTNCYSLIRELRTWNQNHTWLSVQNIFMKHFTRDLTYDLQWF